MSTPKMTAEDVLGAGRLVILQRMPYLYAKVLLLAWRVAVGLGTVAVTKRMVALYDPAAVALWSPNESAGAQIHEIMHLAMSHHDRCGERDPRLWNMAGDLCINPGILAAGMALPKGVLLPEQFHLPPDLAAEQYYDLLQQEQAKQQQQGGQGQGQNQSTGHEHGEGQGQGNDQGKGEGQSQGQGSGQPKLGGGWCGSCAGHAAPNEPADGDPSTGERSEAEVGRMAREVAEAIKEQAQKGQGKVPAGWARWADAALEPAKIPWQTELARAVRLAVDRRPGAVNLTSSRMGRRQAGVGYGVGRPVLPALYAPVPEVAVVVDTSGSMGSEELNAAIRECRGVLAAVGASVQFVACDCDVHAFKKVATWQEATALLKGGGGSDLRPAFDNLAAQRTKPGVVICITDGMIGVPAAEPAWARVIWVEVGSMKRKPCEWGRHIEVD